MGVSIPQPISHIGSSGAHSAGFPGENFVAASQGEAGKEKETKRNKKKEKETKRKKKKEKEIKRNKKNEKEKDFKRS